MPNLEGPPFEERRRVPARITAVFVVYGIYYILGSTLAHLVFGVGALLVTWAAIDRLTMPRTDRQARSELMLLGAGCAVAVAGAVLTSL